MLHDTYFLQYDGLIREQILACNILQNNTEFTKKIMISKTMKLFFMKECNPSRLKYELFLLNIKNYNKYCKRYNGE